MSVLLFMTCHKILLIFLRWLAQHDVNKAIKVVRERQLFSLSRQSDFLYLNTKHAQMITLTHTPAPRIAHARRHAPNPLPPLPAPFSC